jgi:hypothetical protein
MVEKRTRSLSSLGLAVVLSFLPSCASHPKFSHQIGTSHPSNPNLPNSGQENHGTGETVELPPEVQEESLPEQKPFQTEASSFAVYIDGAGFDAIAALGFMQELEKAGYRPVKVAGTGFGCWVALSWALENRGTRAEWQTFKWDDFSVVEEKGLLGRLQGISARRRRTEDEIRRFLTASSFGDFSIPVDCPVVSNRLPFELESGRSLGPVTAFWQELQIPSLGAPEAEALQLPMLSGAVAGTPYPSELEDLSRDVYSKETARHFAGWLVLRTRTSWDRGGSSKWNQILVERAKGNAAANGITPGGVSWMVLNIADKPQRAVAEIRKAGNRRRWLLQGRAKAKALLQRLELKNFLGTPAPNSNP